LQRSCNIEEHRPTPRRRGHYVADIRQGDKWLRFDDTAVTTLGSKEAPAPIGRKVAVDGHARVEYYFPHLLFYTRSSSSPVADSKTLKASDKTLTDLKPFAAPIKRESAASRIAREQDWTAGYDFKRWKLGTHILPVHDLQDPDLLRAVSVSLSTRMDTLDGSLCDIWQFKHFSEQGVMETSPTFPYTKVRITSEDAFRLKPGEWMNNHILTELGHVMQQHVDPLVIRFLPALFYEHLEAGHEMRAAMWMRSSVSNVDLRFWHHPC
jgi:hypothetical protein